MDISYLSLLIVVLINLCDCDKHHEWDYKKIYKIAASSRADRDLERTISKELRKFLKAHKVRAKRGVTEIKQMLKDTQSKLSKSLALNDKKVKKFKIQKRNDENIEEKVSPNQNRYVVDTDFMEVQESVGHNNFAAPYNDYESGQNNRRPNTFRDNRNNEQLKRNEEESEDDQRDTAEEYEEPIPFKNNEKPVPTYPSTDRNAVRQQTEDDERIRSKFSTTIPHNNGRGYHTSYFIPNNDFNSNTKTSDGPKEQSVHSKSNDFWKPESDHQMTRNNPNSDVFIQKTVHDVESKPRPKPKSTPPPYKANVGRPMRFSQPIPSTPVIQPQPIPYEQIDTDLTYFADAAQVYGYPPMGYHDNVLVQRKPIIPSDANYYPPPQPSPPLARAKISHQQETRTINHKYKPREPMGYKRAPVLVKEEDQQIHQNNQKMKTTPKPVHWTRIVSELNEQKNRANEDWKQQTRQLTPQRRPMTDSSDNKYHRMRPNVRSL